MAKAKAVKPAVGETENTEKDSTETQPPASAAEKEKKAKARTEITAAKELCDQIMELAETKGWHFVNEVAALVARHK